MVTTMGPSAASRLRKVGRRIPPGRREQVAAIVVGWLTQAADRFIEDKAAFGHLTPPVEAG